MGKNMDGWMIRMGSFGTDDKDRDGNKIRRSEAEKIGSLEDKTLDGLMGRMTGWVKIWTAG